ncbi:hypothetical protein EBZ80_08885 [bacterium]|nr:hypothetical protein [bacterium]
MDLFGRARFWHPERKDSCYVLEQKLEYNDFVPLDNGVFVFFISPDLTRAERVTTLSAAETTALLEDLSEKGWLPLEENADVPKLNEWVKWHICPKIRSVLPQ